MSKPLTTYRVVYEQPEPKPSGPFTIVFEQPTVEERIGKIVFEHFAPAPKPLTRLQRRVQRMLERQAKAGLAEAEAVLAKIKAARDGQ